MSEGGAEGLKELVGVGVGIPMSYGDSSEATAKFTSDPFSSISKAMSR